jgi:hypothetical protein
MTATAAALNFGRDSNNLNAFAPFPSNNIWNATLTDGSESHITIPSTSASGFWNVSFRYQAGTDVWVDVTGATAAVPASGTLTSATAELNPASLTLASGTKISMISANTTADVAIVMWQASYKS